MNDAAQLFFFRHAPVVSATQAGGIDAIYKGLGIAMRGAVSVVVAVTDSPIVIGVTDRAAIGGGVGVVPVISVVGIMEAVADVTIRRGF